MFSEDETLKSMKRIALLMLQMVIRGKRKFRGVDEGDLSFSNNKP